MNNTGNFECGDAIKDEKELLGFVVQMTSLR